MWEYEQPVNIIFGNGSINKLGKIIEDNGYKRGLLVTSKFFYKSGFAEKLKEDSQNEIIDIFSEVEPNPTIINIDNCAGIIRNNNIGFIVALGGGSVIDCAKASGAVSLTNDSIKKYHGTNLSLPNKSIPIIAIPTTSGTGSEVTCVSVVTDKELGKKTPIVSKSFYPKLALIDPELTYSLPDNITASTGIDVLCHAVEGYWSKGHQPICDALAVHSARLVFDYLERAYLNPRDGVAKEKLAEASIIAGLSFTLPKTTSSHACSFLLTSKYNIPHGEACGLTLDYFTRFNGEKDERVNEFSRLLGFKDANEMADNIYRLKKNIGLLVDLKHLKLTDNDILELVEKSKNANLMNNPINISDDELLKMYTTFK
ncbi:iron-containing alcohol dehydrogenase family protein [Clostridium chromiireducens]|uniref:iron-containing alcohol dehydrogenase family protein n=1 Tax=Clostridium chromiireducens TaxID=225345 RepID=UPI003AF4A27C